YLKDMYEAQQGAFSENNSAVQQFIFSNESRRDMRQDFFNSTNLRNDIQVFKFEPNEADFGAGGVTIEHVTLTDKDNIPLSWIVGGESVALKIFLLAKKDVYSPIVGFFVKNYLGQNLFGDNTFLTYQMSPVRVSAGEMFEASFCFTMPILEKGDFSFSVAVAEGTQENHIQHDWKHDALIIRSVASSCATGMIGIPMQHIEIKNGSSGENFNNAKGSG
ncbi:MAG: Wzt carbohydrate-binding domain-containing protein, partial [Anaerotignum sp.]|nr:Wzt carbohydrate-binding domain-containing protein [Anaerotignum sp.]